MASDPPAYLHAGLNEALVTTLMCPAQKLWLITDRFVKHAVLSVLVFAAGTVAVAIAEHVIINTPVPAVKVGRGAGEPLHTV